MRGLIINADDFGLTAGVSRGILTGHRQGLITSTSMLAVATGFDAAVALATSGQADDLGIGAHLALVGEDPPLLSAREVPTLVGKRGGFAPSWKPFLARVAARRVDPADVRRELTAQIERLGAIGRPLTHIDTHQHLHMWPLVRDVVLELAQVHGIGAIRVPWSRKSGPTGVTVRRLARQLTEQVATRGLTAPEDFVGLDEAGALTEANFLDAIATLAAGKSEIAELGCHPGEGADTERRRYRWNYQWEDELAAVQATAVRAAVGAAGFNLVNFSATTGS